MTNDITEILDKLGLGKEGVYNDGFYVIDIDNSDDYARYQTRLSKIANDSENPSQELNTDDTLVKWTSYYTMEVNSKTYNLFLIADFDNNTYQLKIGKAE